MWVFVVVFVVGEEGLWSGAEKGSGKPKMRSRERGARARRKTTVVVVPTSRDSVAGRITNLKGRADTKSERLDRVSLELDLGLLLLLQGRCGGRGGRRARAQRGLP